jgi:hypothetical protein
MTIFSIKTSTLATLSFAALISITTNSFSSEAEKLKSQYIGQESRTIKSLSSDDIEQLSAGKGWGLAKAAELNGVPGPAHLLEMKNEIALTKAQTIKIESLYDKMKLQAQKLGKKLILLEAKLNESFSNNTINKTKLMSTLTSIEKVRKELRYVHLATHLETPNILSSKQITKYNKLRGYTNNDPCNNVPKGHDKAMWLQHNGCKK